MSTFFRTRHAEHKGTPQDKQNFTLLMQAIRDSIDAYGEKIKYKFLLTAALGAAPSNMENIEWDKVKDILDLMNIMSYDYNGVWSPDANHNSPLYEPASPAGWGGSLDASFTRLTQQYKVPPEKICVGVAFYGRSLLMKDMESCKLYSTEHLKKTDTITFAVDEGQPQYFNILLQKHKFTEMWDDTSKVPYLIGNPGKNRYTIRILRR
ncbi:MAG: glycosyl hydrolase family 18 protein [Cytophagaceae bacterium]|nr:glycosyl hydrolase family 18 protein [Cytophagaceae bacterium]